MPPQLQLCRPTTVTAYSQLCSVQHRAWFYLWQSFQTLKAAKKNTQSWKVKGFQDVECWHHSYIWQTSHDANANLGEPSNSTENTWSQNWMKTYLEGNSLQEALTCTDVKSSTFRVTLHHLFICCYWKRDVSFYLPKHTHLPTMFHQFPC